jgi:protein SCO1/2
VLLRCYHYDPVTGKYDVAVLNIARFVGVATMLGVGALVLISRRDGKSSKRQDAKDARKEEDVSFGTAHL